MAARIITSTLPLGDLIARHHGQELEAPDLTEEQKARLGAMIVVWHYALRGGAGVDNAVGKPLANYPPQA